MTCNLTNTPLFPEPLPLYSRNDPDAISIRSAAPSYVSEAPTYTSTPRHPGINLAPQSLLPPLSPDQVTRGLPAPRYAPGFTDRAHGSIQEPHLNSFSVSSWTSTRTRNNSRQYNAVARRRANQEANTTAILNSLAAVPPPLTTGGSPNASSTQLNAYPVQPGSSSEPVNPLEDPYLVGEEAATRARRARVYREMCLHGQETQRYESRSWDFMLGQMEDWSERDRSWRNFKSRVGQTKLLGRRLGLRS
ncbi:hypothetical protein EJ04DRAFT_514447 [Polyplosphaeria fusca]|uniref:Uncharacterized protein n=1 Tax=Polyplosphaeria fusca TaxID=682080 RepID=A0A9P4V011_9PLEO|nr:hypothetical protein EJ04DRAFT_514447 [Polyplosphaeria fusca]